MNKSKILLYISFFIVLASFASAIDVSSCGKLNQSGGSYTLTQSLSSPGASCIIINNNSITLDCGDYNITGNSYGTDIEYGINITGFNYTTITSCDVTGFTYGLSSANNINTSVIGGDYSENGPESDSSNENDGFGVSLSNSHNFTLRNLLVSNIYHSTQFGPIFMEMAYESWDKGRIVPYFQGIGEELNYQDTERCYGKFCNLTQQQLILAIDKAISKGLNYELNDDSKDSFSNTFNRLLLLKYTSLIKEDEAVEKKLPDMLQELSGKANSPAEIPMLNLIDPKFDYNNTYYKNLKEHPPAESELDAVTTNNQLSIIAYYCDDLFMNYNASTQKYLLDYFTKTAVGNISTEEDTYYMTTHSLIYLDWMAKKGCIDKSYVEKVANATIFRNKLFSSFTDWHLEGAAVTLLTNNTDKFNEAWIPIILENQQKDGGWRFTLDYNESNTHTTGLALVALKAYKNYILEKKAYNLGVPIPPLKYGNMSYALSSESENTKYGVYVANSNYGLIDNVNGTNTRDVDYFVAPTEYGIYMTSSNFTTIQNSNLSLQCYGIYIESSINVTMNNTITDNSLQSGTVISSSPNTKLLNCHAQYNGGLSDNSGIYITSGSQGTLVDHCDSQDNGVGVYLYGASNITVQNSIFDSNGNYPGGYGIYVYGTVTANYNNIINNTANDNTMYGIYSSSTNNYNLYENNTVAGNTYDGFYMNTAKNSTFKGNKILRTGDDAFYLAVCEDNDIIGNTVNDTVNHAMRDQGGKYNNFTNNFLYNASVLIYIQMANNSFWDGNIAYNTTIRTGIGASGFGIHITSADAGKHASHNIIQNTNLTQIANSTAAVFIDDKDGSHNLNNTLINVTYDGYSETVDANSTLIRKWWYSALVNDTEGNLLNSVNVSAYNVSDSLEFTTTTDATGYTPLKGITEYVNNAGTKTYYSNYTINASKTGYVTSEKSWNITGNLLSDLFTLESTAPIVTLTYPTNNTQTISALNYFAATFTDDDALKNATLYVWNSTNNIISGTGGTYCYQETANASNANDGSCGLNYSGSYGVDDIANWADNFPSSIFDGDWDTGTYSSGGGYFYVNYTKPAGATINSLWRVKYESIYNSNLTIPSSCWNYDSTKLIFRAYSTDSDGQVGWYCYDGSWNQLLLTAPFSASTINEEAMYWDLSRVSITGKSNSTNLSLTLPYLGTFKWNYYACDSSGNCDFDNANYTLTLNQNPNLTECVALTQANTIYALQNDVTTTGTCFTIAANNITLDGKGKKITGGGDGSGIAYWGVYADGRTNITIHNITITNFGDSTAFSGGGIYLASSSSSVTSSNISGNIRDGIYVAGNNNIINNSVVSSNLGYGGINLQSGNDNIIDNLVSNGNSVAILNQGTRTIITNIVLRDNLVYGISCDMAGCPNMMVRNAILDNDGYGGIYITGVGNVNLDNITISNCKAGTGGGVWVATAYNSNFTNIKIINSTNAGSLMGGIQLTDAGTLNFINITLDGNDYGIHAKDNAGDLNFTNITIINSIKHAVYLDNSYAGVQLWFDGISITNTNAGFKDLYAVTSGAHFIDYSIGRYNLTSPHNFTFKTTGKSLIEFLEDINGTGNNLSYDVQTGNNLVFVNSSNTGLNKSANITLYSIGDRGFIVPAILKDGTTICNETTTPSCYNFTSLTADTVKFNVSSWSNYSIGEGDMTAPNAVLLAPANNTISSNTSYNFTSNLTDDLGIKNATLYIYNSSDNLVNETSTTFAEGVTEYVWGVVVNLVDGIYKWFVSLFDRAGSSYTTGNYTLRVNDIPIVTSVKLNTTGIFNLSVDNLTGYVTVAADLDNITVAYNWYKNDTLNATTLITNDLVSYWPLNNDTLDYYGTNDGTNVGATQTSGRIGNAYRFNGSILGPNMGNTQIEIDDPVLGSTQMSVCAWIKKMNTDADYGGIVTDYLPAPNPNWILGYESPAGTMAFWVDNDHIEATGFISNQWHLICGVFNGDTDELSLYRDTTKFTTTTTEDTLGATQSDSSYIGCYYWDTANSHCDYPFNGTIDEVMIFNRSLSSSEVSQLYWAGVAGGHTMNASQTTEGDVWKLGVKAGDYMIWGNETNSSTVTIMANTAPNTTSVILNSTNPLLNDTNQNLTCYANITDLEDVIVYANYTWYNNTVAFLSGQSEALTQGVTSLIATLGAGNTTKTQNWTCSVQGYDITTYETDWNNATLTILNSLPNTTSVIINSTNPSTNDTNQNLTCYALISDSDGDSVYGNYTWYLNGTANLTGQSGALTQGVTSLVATLGAGNTTKNQNWSCSVQAYDGAYEGAWKSSSNLTILNSAPNTTSVILNSTNPLLNDTNQNLTCYANIADLDGDTIYGNYTWYNNTIAFLSGQSEALTQGVTSLIATLGAGNTTAGQNWTCSVMAYDGTDYEADWNNATLTILNSLPNTTSVILNSSLGTNYTDEDLTCYANITDVNGDSVYANYTWYNNSVAFLSGQSGTFVSGTINLITTLGNGNTTKGQNWTCSVKAYDSSDYEVDWNNATITILNTAPNTPAVILNTTNIQLNDSDQNLTGYITSTDVDGDNITYWYNWYRNGTLNATTLITANLTAYYPFNNDSLDYWNSYDASQYGGVALSEGKVGGAYHFDGVDDIIKKSSFPDFSTQLTIASWFKIDADNQYLPIVTRGWYSHATQSEYLTLDASYGNNNITYRIRHDLPFKEINYHINKDTWYHVVATYNNGNMELFVDGVSVGTATGADLLPSTGYDLKIGGFSTEAPAYSWMNGTIDEVMVWNRALNASEAEMLYKGSKHGGNVLGSEYTTKGDVWNLGARAGDNLAWDAEVNSSNVTILNTLPHTDSVIINSTNPSTNDTNQNLTCYALISDSDGDSVYGNYTWYLNGTANLTGQSGALTQGVTNLIATLGAGNTTKTQNWSCSVQSYDGTGYEGHWHSSSNLTILNALPIASALHWYMIGGAVDDTTLGYHQTIDYITATATDIDNDSLTFNYTLTDPSGDVRLNNVSMTVVDNLNSNYTTDFELDEVGTWTLVVYPRDTAFGTLIQQAVVVSRSTQDLTEFYGYDPEGIPTNETLEELGQYGYNLVEITDYATSLNANWTTNILPTIVEANSLNMKVGLKFELDYNLTNDSVSRDTFINNITEHFPDLTSGIYLDTVEYIKFDVNLSLGYSDTNITDNNLDKIAAEAVDVTYNYFVIFTNYNSSTLDDDYIAYAENLNYVTGPTSEDLINHLANLTRVTTSMTRIYYNLSSAQKEITHTYQDNIVIPILGTPNITTRINHNLVSELITGDLIVYNNESTTKNYTYNVSNGTRIVGYDLWDYTKHIMLANDSDGMVTFLNISPYSAILVGSEEIDHIEMETDVSATVHEQSASTTYVANYTDGVGNVARALSTTRAMEFWDPSWSKLSTSISYIDFSASVGITPPYVYDGVDGYTYVVINDKDDAYIDPLFWDNISIGQVFGYISVGDYQYDNATWVAAKQAQVDAWMALNESLGIFFDGLDIGQLNDLDGTFEGKMKNLTDYVKIDKGGEVAVNVFTNYKMFAQFSSENGFAMIESCIRTWHACEKGTTDCYGSYNSTHGYNYSNQYWEDYAGYGDYNKSIWYNSHNVPLVCVIFMARNTSAYYPDSLAGTPMEDYENMLKWYYQAKVLGYENIIFTEPGFNSVYFDKMPNLGTKLQTEPTKTSDKYCMRYTKGTVCYNVTADTATWDENLVFNNASFTFRLQSSDWQDMINDICINDYCGYTIQSGGAGYPAWQDDPSTYYPFTLYFNETVYDNAHGHYLLTISSASANTYIAADTMQTKHARLPWYNNSGTWGLEGDGYYQDVVWMTINLSHAGTIDTTTEITQTNTSEITTSKKLYNISIISSIYDFSTNIWTKATEIVGGVFREINVWNASSFVQVNYTNSSACITTNPSFTLNQILGIGSVGVCLYEDAGVYKIRFQWPRLEAGTTYTAQIDMDDLSPIITVLYPTNGSYYKGNYSGFINISIDETGGNCSINDTRWTYNSGNTTFFSFLNSSVIETGYTSLNISCWDEYLNNGSILFSFTADPAWSCSLYGMTGTGAIATPCGITNWTQLNATKNNLTASYILMNNLSSSTSDYVGFGDSWYQIGNCGPAQDSCTSEDDMFEGTFNGNGYYISNLTIPYVDEFGVGLFGYSTGNITNLNVGVDGLSGYGRIGGIVGQNDGWVTNCSATVYGTIFSRDNAGSLVGLNNGGTIINSSATVKSSGVVSTQIASSGGLVGYNLGGTITGCSATVYGNITAGMNDAGGLVALDAGGTITDSQVTIEDGGLVKSATYSGGLIGYSDYAHQTINCSTILKSGGTITATTSYAGGLVGYHSNTITGSSAVINGTITATTSYAGGLVGYFEDTVFSVAAITSSSVTLYDSATIDAGTYTGLITSYNNGGTITSYGTVDDTTYGNITFLDWNVTSADGDNLTSHIYINNNSAYVNSSISGFNRSANITLLGIGNRGFSLPAILKDGTTICNETTTPSCYNFTSLTADTVKFNVSSWSNYSIGEGDTTPPSFDSGSPYNMTVEFGSPTIQQINATDAISFDCFYINDTTNFKINCSGYFENNTYLPVGTYWVNVTANDSANNKVSKEFYVDVVDTTSPVCTLVSRTPTDINASATGPLSIVMNCTDLSGINTTQTGDHYKFFITRTVDAFILSQGIPNYWSNRYPNNSISVIGTLTPPYKIWRALGRNEGYWYDSLTDQNLINCSGVSPCYRPLNDTFSYAIEDGEYGHFTVTQESPTNVIINYTHPAVDIAAFRQSVYLSYESMVKEEKKNNTIKLNNYVLMKRFDAEAYRGTQNYTMNSYRDFGVVGTPARTLRAFYCNSSYNPVAGIKVINSPNCALINSLTKTDLENIKFTDRNSSYSKGTYAITNGKFGGIGATTEFYIEYESPENPSTGAYYQLRYANGSAEDITDVDFKNSSIAWTTTNGGASWTQAAWTPDVFTTTVRSANDQFEFGYYVEDNQSNAGYNFTFLKDEITDVSYPITYPLVLEYNSSVNTLDDNLNGTHKGVMQIKVGIATDPDIVGNVTHNLTLRNMDGSWNYTINGSFVSADDSDIWISFNTSLVSDGHYRMNISATSGEDPTDVKSRMTDRNFTIDNTAPNAVLLAPANNTISTNTSYNFTSNLTDNLGIQNATLFIYEEPVTLIAQNSSSFGGAVEYVWGTVIEVVTEVVERTYYWFVSVWDLAGNIFTSDTRYLSIDTIAPVMTGIPPNVTLTYPEATISEDFNATDAHLDSWFINSTTYFQINSTTGIFTNKTSTIPYGTYIINVSVNDTLGHVTSTDYKVTVNQNAGACDVLFNVSSPIIYPPTTFTAYTNCNSGYMLYRNGTAIANNSLQELTAGTYNFTVNRNDTFNYTYITDTEIFVVNENIAPTVTLISPADATVTANSSITFSCNVTEDFALTNLSLWHNLTGIWHQNQTATTTGTSYTKSWTLSNIPLGDYIWNCLAYDSIGQSDWGDSNRSLTINTNLTECINLTQANVHYTLGKNITSIVGTCFRIQADGIILDGNGFQIAGDSVGSTDYGVYATGRSNITIQNFQNISKFYTAVYLTTTTDSFVYNSNFTSNDYGVVLFTGSNNNIIENLTLNSNDASGIDINSNNNTLNSIDASYNGLYGVTINGNTNNLSDITTKSNLNSGVWLYSASTGNSIINLNSYQNKNYQIKDQASGTNYLSYNNTFGEIRWTKTSFLQDLTTNGTMTFPGNITITNNSAYVNAGAFSLTQINSTANITLYGIGDRGFSNPVILKDGLYCTDCYNFTSLEADTVIFNVSSWSNYSIGDDIFPNTTLISPANNTYTPNASINFTINLTDDRSIKNATLYVYNSTDDLVNESSITFAEGEATNYLWGIVVNLVDDIFHWFATIFDWAGNSQTTGNYTLTVDLTAPGFSSIPANATLVYLTDSLGVDFDATDVTNVSTYFINDTTRFDINQSGYLKNITTLGVDVYYINVSVNDTWNHVNSYIYMVNVTKNAGACDIGFDITSPATYPASFRAYTNCTSAYMLYRNGTIIANNSLQELTAGTYNFTVNRNDTFNYTYITDTETFTINKGTATISSYLNGVSANLTVMYPQPVNASGSINPHGFCYQETANVATECGGLSTGVYAHTELSGDYGEEGHIFVNYSKPRHAINSSLLQVKHGTLGTQNISIPSTCWNYDNTTLSFRYISTTQPQVSVVECYNGSWVNISKDYSAGGIADSWHNDVWSTFYDGNWNTQTHYMKNSDLSNSNWTSNGGYPTGIFVLYEEAMWWDMNVSSGTLTIYRNGTAITNGANYTLSVGYYMFNYSVIGNENYTDTETYLYANVTQNTGACDMLFNTTSPVMYPESFNISTNCNSGYQIWRNGTEITGTSVQSLAAGTYNFTVTRNDTMNYSNIRDEEIFVVNKNTQPCDIMFNETSPLTYPSAFKVYTNCTTDFIIYRNGTAVVNNSVQSLAGGTYNFTVNRNDTLNYTYFTDTEYFTIDKATGVVYTYLDGARANKTVLNASVPGSTPIWLNGTLVTGTGTISLYDNGTLINTGASPLANYTNFTVVGLHNISTIYDGNENYTSSIETWYVNVIQMVVPSVNFVAPLDNHYYNNKTQLVNITNSSTAVAVWWNNGTGANITYTVPIYYNFSEGNHTIFAYANSTTAHQNSTNITFVIDITDPSFSGESRTTPLNNQVDGTFWVNITEVYRDTIYFQTNVSGSWKNFTPTLISTVGNTSYYNFTVKKGNWTQQGQKVNWCWWANDSATNIGTSCSFLTLASYCGNSICENDETTASCGADCHGSGSSGGSGSGGTGVETPSEIEGLNFKVWPSGIDEVVLVGQILEKTITIKNFDSVGLIIDVSTTLTVEPNQLVVMPGEEKTIILKLYGPIGEYKDQIKLKVRTNWGNAEEFTINVNYKITGFRELNEDCVANTDCKSGYCVGNKCSAIPPKQQDNMIEQTKKDIWDKIRENPIAAYILGSFAVLIVLVIFLSSIITKGDKEEVIKATSKMQVSKFIPPK